MYGYIRSEAVYIVGPFLTVYILPSLSILPIPFLVMVGTGVIVDEVVLVLADRHSLL